MALLRKTYTTHGDVVLENKNSVSLIKYHAKMICLKNSKEHILIGSKIFLKFLTNIVLFFH